VTESNNCDSESPVNRFSSKFSCKKEHKVLIISDSHTRNCAANVKTDIMDNLEVQGFVKPGAGTGFLVKSATSDIMNLTKSDVLIFCGGANTFGKNNSR
jgi:predicted phosphodiesterase